MDHDVGAASLLHPTRLFSAAEIIADFTLVPKSAGVYAWYFDEVPPGVPTEGCHRSDGGQVLLYVGIAPKKSADGTIRKRTLRHRLRDHLIGNAEGSTLRLTLGCVLADELGLQLRRVGSGKRRTFTNPGEVVLDGWLAAHAYIAFAAVEQPWELEAQMLTNVSLPLNLSGNTSHSFGVELSRIRADAKRQAAALPVVADNGGPRRAISAIPGRGAESVPHP